MVTALFKVILMGDGSVGKTSLRRQYMGEGFRANYMITIGADFAVKKMSLEGGHDVSIQIWDLAGQEHFKNVRSTFYKGAQGALAALSFNGNKIITTSGGGMLVSRNKQWIDRARYLATQARDPAPHYEHSTIGYNYRLSNLLAAIGRGQLRHLDDRVQRRRRNFDYYQTHLSDLPGFAFMPEASYGRSNRWLTCITIDPARARTDREAVRKHLERHDVEARPVWKPMHRQPVFADHRVYGGSVADRIFDQGLCLPSGSSLTDEDLTRVVRVIREACEAMP